MNKSFPAYKSKYKFYDVFFKTKYIIKYYRK